MHRARPSLLPLVLLIPSTSWIRVAGRAVGGVALGIAAGIIVTMGLLVARAQFDNHYVESVTEVVGWQAAAVPVGAVAGGAAGVAGPAILAAASLGVLAGGGVGVAIGAAMGVALGARESDIWAGGTMGGAVGVVLGFIAGWVMARRRRRSRERGAGAGTGAVAATDPHGRRNIGSALAALLVGSVLASGCGDDDLWLPEAPPVPANVAPAEDVVILLGDAGMATFQYYPVLPRVAAEVATWAAEIGRDSAVTVLNLGDIVYPDGVHEPGSPGFPEDSARVASQIQMVGTPTAREYDVRQYMVAGNHDWGLREDRVGARRLRNLGAFVDWAREGGANVALVPPAGVGIPHVADIGDWLRVILLDTAWWLFDAEPEGKDDMVEAVAAAMAGAGSRHVVIAAHHPFETAGPHGGVFPVWETLGLRRVLYKSGALLQDIDSRPYRELRESLSEIFVEHGRPLVWAGGHEHSLQVIAHDTATAPHFSIVSGSASKLTGVGLIDGTLFQASAPGYITLIIRENGAVDVEVVGAPEPYVSCIEEEPNALPWEQCMAEAAESFETLYTARLAEPESPAPGIEGRESRSDEREPDIQR